ncbi:uncharacterized protein LOC132278714 [Cornus florida]|uniref:uncharacterized protein LOC132278714 n=1 Tax=Cornus florida TaxID=4283 RepID=UPI0028A2065F|nr:uncharacterized protein LOC132278714 [Cornus florida]
MWRDVPDFEKEICYDHLKEVFGVDAYANDTDFKRVNMGISSAVRKYRYKLKCHFEEHLPIENARRHPYNVIGNAVWQKYCDTWMSPKFQVKLKERQSQEDEDGERVEDPAIRLSKDTHFKEQGGWAHEKAKTNFDAMKEKAAQNSQNSDGTSPTINDVEIAQNQLGIRKGYCRRFGHGFVAP